MGVQNETTFRAHNPQIRPRLAKQAVKQDAQQIMSDFEFATRLQHLERVTSGNVADLAVDVNQLLDIEKKYQVSSQKSTDEQTSVQPKPSPVDETKTIQRDSELLSPADEVESSDEQNSRPVVLKAKQEKEQELQLSVLRQFDNARAEYNRIEQERVLLKAEQNKVQQQIRLAEEEARIEAQLEAIAKQRVLEQEHIQAQRQQKLIAQKERETIELLERCGELKKLSEQLFGLKHGRLGDIMATRLILRQFQESLDSRSINQLDELAAVREQLDQRQAMLENIASTTIGFGKRTGVSIGNTVAYFSSINSRDQISWLAALGNMRSGWDGYSKYERINGLYNDTAAKLAIAFLQDMKALANNDVTHAKIDSLLDDHKRDLRTFEYEHKRACYAKQLHKKVMGLSTGDSCSMRVRWYSTTGWSHATRVEFKKVERDSQTFIDISLFDTNHDVEVVSVPQDYFSREKYGLAFIKKAKKYIRYEESSVRKIHDDWVDHILKGSFDRKAHVFAAPKKRIAKSYQKRGVRQLGPNCGWTSTEQDFIAAGLGKLMKRVKKQFGEFIEKSSNRRIIARAAHDYGIQDEHMADLFAAIKFQATALSSY